MVIPPASSLARASNVSLLAKWDILGGALRCGVRVTAWTVNATSLQVRRARSVRRCEGRAM